MRSDAAITTKQAVPEGWSVHSLGELTTWISGGTPSKGNPAFWDGDTPWISAKSLKSFYLYDSEDHVTDAAIAEGARQVDVGDILMLVRGMTLHNDVPVGIAMRPMTFNQDVKGLRGKGDASTRYIAYWLIGNKWRLLAAVDQASHGTGRLRTEVVQAMDVLLPPPREQEAIAAVLGALDDKIEQNRRLARALERLARAIFRAWFVDFEPVKAKAAGATAFPSMPQPVFDALPTRFVDSDIGSVPEGWELNSIAKVATFLNGLALQKYPPRGDGHDLRVIKIAQLRKGSTEGADWANADVPRQYIVDDGDLLFSWSGALEAELWFGGKGALNQHLFKVTSSRFPHWYCLLWIRQHLPWFRAIAASKATTMGHIQRRHLQEAQVVIPPTPVLHAADEVIGALYGLHAQIQLESRKLAQMRELLLPQLLSGAVAIEPEMASDGA
mgnify:FL=1